MITIDATCPHCGCSGDIWVEGFHGLPTCVNCRNETEMNPNPFTIEEFRVELRATARALVLDGFGPDRVLAEVTAELDLIADEDPGVPNKWACGGCGVNLGGPNTPCLVCLVRPRDPFDGEPSIDIDDEGEDTSMTPEERDAILIDCGRRGVEVEIPDPQPQGEEY